MKTEAIRACTGWHSPLGVALLTMWCLAVVARAEPDEVAAEGPFQSLFQEDPALRPIPLIPADAYFQVSAALTANPEHGYRWELWALQADGKPIARMAPSGRIASRRLIDLATGDTLGVIDCTNAPTAVAFINRYGRRINLDLCLMLPGELDIQTPYPLYRVQNRERRGAPLDVDPSPIGWIDEFQGMLLNHNGEPVARFEPVRLTELGSRTNQHDLFFDGRSLTTELMAAPPSQDLLRRLEIRAAALHNGNALPTKLLRVELAARWLHAEAALITDKNATIALPPERIAEARRALAATPITDLNYLWKDSTRRVLWDALAAAHPQYRFYAEGVALAGLRDDPEVLDHTLRLLKAVWMKGSRDQIKIKRQGPFEDWMQAGLIDDLKFQSVRTSEDALALASEIKVVQPSTLVRPRAIGEPPVTTAYPMSILRAGNQVSAMDRAIHIAAALQRGGRDVTLWSLSVEKIIDNETKTKIQEPLLVFPREAGKPEVLVLGADAILTPLKGKKIAPGYYEFPALASLQPLLARSAQFQVSMVGVLDGQTALAPWTAGIQKALAAIRLDDPSLTATLLESSGVNSWEHYNSRAADSIATLAQSRFTQLVRDNNIVVRIERVQDGKIVSTSVVRNIDSRPADEILSKHEATIGRCFHLLPRKMEDGIRVITLRSDPILEPLPTAVIEDGKIRIDTRDRRVIGRGGPTGIMLAAPSFPEAYHEMMHRWGNSRVERFEVGDWKGNLVEPFNDISWQRKEKEPGWERRSDNFKIEDYWWDYGATNEREDFAVIGQFYGSLPGPTRARVRSELKKGNFVPAAKYLYFKSIAFLDSDGRSLEIDIDASDKPFTIAEFENAVRAVEKKDGLNEEQERMRDLVKRIKALNALLREKKTGMRRSEELPLPIHSIAGYMFVVSVSGHSKSLAFSAIA